MITMLYYKDMRYILLDTLRDSFVQRIIRLTAWGGLKLLRANKLNYSAVLKSYNISLSYYSRERDMAHQEAPDPLYTIRGDMKAIHCSLFQIDYDSEFLYTSTQAGLIHKWNLKTCREESTIQVSEEACLSVRNIGQYLISQTKGGVITVWEDKDGHWHTKSKICFEYWGFCKLDTLSGKYLVVPTSGSKVNIMSLEGETVNMLSPVLEKTCGEIMCLKCLTLSDTNYVFVLYECGLLILFESNGRLVSQIEITSDCPMALDFDGESKGVIGTSGNTLAGFLIQSQLTLSKWTETVLTNPGVSSVAVRPDKKLVAAGCWDSRIRLFSMKSLRLLVVVISHRESIQDICYSPARVEAWNSSWLLAASGKDGRVTLWNLY